ncbi:MAG: hypothetical protein ACR2L6_09410 [Gemmatimonadaceae bacterium]
MAAFAIAGGGIASRATGAERQCPRGSLPAYAHNDYENPRPLQEAVERGFRGVEVDLFLVDGTLRVGHDRRRARDGAAFEALYLEPLSALVARCGALTSDGHPFLLAVDFKERSAAAYDALVGLLSGYHSLLARSPAESVRLPSIEIVLVGWHPADAGREGGADSLLRLQHRLSSPSAPHRNALDPRVRLVSLDYGKTMGRWWLSPADRWRWIAALRAVKDAVPDRLLRVHNVPADARIYGRLLGAGVDLIGAKRLATTQRLLSGMTPP